MWTPWGKVQSQHKVPGKPIWWVSTAGHGGFIVDRKWAWHNLSKAAFEIGEYGSATWSAYEEDCDLSIILHEVPEVSEWFRTNKKIFSESMPKEKWDETTMRSLKSGNRAYLDTIT